jgi:hypothetical protein
MKMITSVVFEMKLPKEDIEAYQALSDKERETRIEAMKGDLVNLINNECVGKTNFTKFTIEFQEGE